MKSQFTFYLALLVSILLDAFQVSAQPIPEGDNFKLGVQMGVNSTLITGDELQLPKNKTGMVIGAFYRQRLNENLHIMAEVDFSLRGSHFDFTAEKHYNAVKFTYMDFPVQLMFNVSGSKQNQFVVGGLEPSYLLQSEIYVNPDFRAAFQNYGFKRFDISALAGYHFDFYYFGLQPSLKFGLLNINDQLSMPDVLPATANGGIIRNFTFDLKFYF